MAKHCGHFRASRAVERGEEKSTYSSMGFFTTISTSHVMKTFHCSTSVTLHRVIAVRFAIFSGKERPQCGLAGDRDVCDRKTQRFAIAIAILVLSGTHARPQTHRQTESLATLLHVVLADP